MPRKKKQEDIEEFDDEDFELEEKNEESLNDDYTFDSSPLQMDDTPVNPMGLAHQISKESDTVKVFKELPREVKYSFYDNVEKQEIRHYSRTYRNWKYIEKIIDLRVKEDERLKANKKNLIEVKDYEQLINYLKQQRKDYLIKDIEDLKKEDIIKILEHIKTLKENYMLNSIENKKLEVAELYEDYNLNKNIPEYIDDMGNIGKIMDTSLTSMGYKGNASQHSVMTIQAVKNEDIQKVAEEKSKFSLMDTIKRKFG